MKPFQSILPKPSEKEISLPGDDTLPEANVITSAFTLPANVEMVFPWFVQLGKKRAGWYFTRFTEKFFFPSARGIRHIEPKWQALKVGDRIPDYGKDGYFDCFYFEKNRAIGYESQRGNIKMTWVLTFWPEGKNTRVIIRLRLGGFRSSAKSMLKLGELFDRTTIMWLAAGLRERLK